jgi:GT2 family glycosyltransferase
LIWLTGGTGRATAAALDQRPAELGGRAWIPAAGHDSARIGPILAEFSKQFPGANLFLLHRDFPLQAGQLQQLSNWLQQLTEADPRALALTALSNRSERFNPFHNLQVGSAEAPDNPASLVSMLGTQAFVPASDWPDHLLCLNAAAVALLAEESLTAANALARLQDQGGTLLCSDSLFLHDRNFDLLTHAHLEHHEQAQLPAWSELSARLSDWLRQGVEWPATASHTQPTATLHITHSWGGGVARWVSNLIDADTEGQHYQLRSERAESGRGAGQKLALYAGNELGASLASWWLQPAIRSSLDQHPFYPQVLQHICRRYRIGRIIVSSLVGHSLDALRSGLPSVQVLHDYYPLWPLLGVNPLPYVQAKPSSSSAAATTAPGTALASAMQEHPLLADFGVRDAAGWQELAMRWRQTLQQQRVRLAAPSQSVVNLLRQLDSGWNDQDIRVIPHGLTAFADDAPVLPKARADGRLRLVIPGRMQTLKGQALLLAALPELTRLAQVYLLGTGKDGEAFFGQSGVNVILQYDRDDLPAILREIGPHLAALLSVVPETFSYTLSEMRQLNIPVLATRVGSLAERIEDGRDGWLIETNAAALVERVRELAARPELIETMRQNLKELPGFSNSEMLQQYQQLCPLVDTAIHLPPTAGFEQLQYGAATLAAATLTGSNLQLQHQVVTLQAEVDKRTDWAREREAARQAEQSSKEKWVKQLQQEIDTRSAELAHEQAKVATLEQQYATILASSSWRLTKPLRAGRRVVANLSRAQAWNPVRWPLLLSQAVRTISTTGLRGALIRAQLSPQQLTEPATTRDYTLETVGDLTPPASLPYSAQPRVSVIIPVFNKWAYTAACLRSLASSRNLPPLEVILVDDHSRDETAGLAQQVNGLQYLRNSRNLGFVGSCNRGLEVARGEFTVLLNNDTQVLDGWLDALLQTFEKFPDTGLAGAQLLYPDGSLQEAGGIIFDDGSGWNYGKHDNADKPEYHCVREVDYCSGACIMLRSEVFRELNGFDARYAPAYYEDTDLAFRVREAGLKVRYQPAARIIHFEGITSGTDLNSGAKRYQQVNRSKFLQRWEAVLKDYPAPIVNPDDQREIRRARDHRLKGRVLVIDAYTPEPDQDSGSLRLTYIFDCLQQLGYGVSFFADNRGYAGRYSQSLQAAGVEVLYNPWIASLQDFFRERGPEFNFIMVSRHYVAANYLALVRKYCPQAKFIFDTVDLHYLREERLAELEDSLPLRRVAAQTKRSELAVIRQADATLVVSPVEQAVLRQDLPEARIEVLSNIHEVAGCQAGFAARKDLFFVGGYQHPPNIDAALWFVNSIWPLVRAQLPEVNFHLIGSKAPERIRSLQGNGVIFHGFVADLKPWLDGCRLAVAPLRYGAGVKGKVNMSMSRGQPVVATPAAVEGLHAREGEDVLVAESAEGFAAAVVRLYQDQALWEKLSQGGLQNVQQYFSLEAACRQLAELLDPGSGSGMT